MSLFVLFKALNYLDCYLTEDSLFNNLTTLDKTV